MDRLVETARSDLPEDVNRALDPVEDDGAALKADCSSELAISLVKKQAETAKAP
jgi:hypothetical protein